MGLTVLSEQPFNLTRVICTSPILPSSCLTAEALDAERYTARLRRPARKSLLRDEAENDGFNRLACSRVSTAAASPVEGVHLRFGPVARGGIRWSDRREDFRTEVLGPDEGADGEERRHRARSARRAASIPSACRPGRRARRPGRRASPPTRPSSRGLLDITDNIVGGEDPCIRRRGAARRRRSLPRRRRRQGHGDLLRHRQRRAQDYGFWLGDAFASGGSAGYDHKKMGITARGAWEAVKRHFREMGQRHPDASLHRASASATCRATCSATACCCRSTSSCSPPSTTATSSSIPRPTGGSLAERKRLFDLPRSSWADYDKKLISGRRRLRAQRQVDQAVARDQGADCLRKPDDARPS
jgi:hypothetical protein